MTEPPESESFKLLFVDDEIEFLFHHPGILR